MDDPEDAAAFTALLLAVSALITGRSGDLLWQCLETALVGPQILNAYQGLRWYPHYFFLGICGPTMVS